MDFKNASKKNSKNSKKNGKKNVRPSLQHLPIEVFLYICSFLEAWTLVHSLSLVCKRFHVILKDESWWMKRINSMWPDATFPVLPLERPDKMFWKLSCIGIEKQTALWKRPNSMQKLRIIDLGRLDTRVTSDALLQMHDGTTCVIGARNSTLVYWNFRSHGKLPSHEIDNSQYKYLAHNKTISDLMAIDNNIYSCSWSVKSWILMNTGLVELGTYKTNDSNTLVCVSSCPEQSFFATGSYRGTIYVFDSRSGNKPINQYRPNNRSVVKLAVNSEYILSLNKTVTVWDQRAGRTMKSITFPDEAIPICMSMQRNWVYIGDSNAKLHMLNPKNDFELIKSYSTEHTEEITGVHLAHGCLITSSMDGTVKVSRRTNPSESIATLSSGFGPIYRMNYLNGILTMSNYENIVVWRPK